MPFRMLKAANHVSQHSWPPVTPTFTVLRDVRVCCILTVVTHDVYLSVMRQGHEIAGNTYRPVVTAPTVASSCEEWRDHITGSRKLVAELTQSSVDDIVGWRGPFLNYNAASWRVLLEDGFLYDSSLVDRQFEGISYHGPCDCSRALFSCWLNAQVCQRSLTHSTLALLRPVMRNAPMILSLDSGRSPSGLLSIQTPEHHLPLLIPWMMVTLSSSSTFTDTTSTKSTTVRSHTHQRIVEH